MEQELNSRLQLARVSGVEADKLIEKYTPFIKAAASKAMKKICTPQDDEYSIALFAFYEAIQSYNTVRGSFLNYAEVCIKSRIIDYLRKEARHTNIMSLDEEDENRRPLHESIMDKKDAYSESDSLNATKEEINELKIQFESFGLSFGDISDNSPKQERTLQICREVIAYSVENPEILEQMLNTKRLPLAQICEGMGVARKTLERHRKYLLAMLIIQTNGYEIIRGHLKRQKG